jgi:CheY-like chemotaxis protein
MTSPAVGLDAGPRLDGVRVLVVDDAREVLQIVTDVLAQDGAKVTAVGSAEEALAALQGERPDVLLSDLAMPGKGGYWLIGQVRALPPERGGVTPAAALTGLTGPAHRASRRILSGRAMVRVLRMQCSRTSNRAPAESPNLSNSDQHQNLH